MNTASFRRRSPASATFDTSFATEKFFKAAIEFAIVENPEEPWEESEPEPEE